MNAPADLKPQTLAERIPLDGTGAVDAARQRDVVRALRGILPEHALLYREEETRPYECDGLTLYRQLPMIVALPETKRRWSRSSRSAANCRCRWCHAARAPDCRAARCRTTPACCCRRRSSTASCASTNWRARRSVQPGVRNLAISEAAAPFGLYYAPDPSSQIACTIGGNVAENSGGVHCLKYGLTVHNVLRVRAVTIDGEIVELGSAALDAPGLDLLALLIGSRGHARRWSPRSPSSWCPSRSSRRW